MEPKPTYTTAESTQHADAKPFTLDCRHQAGTIHRSADRVPYLLLHDDAGHTWHIYGYARAFCQGKLAGEWDTGRHALEVLLSNRHKRIMAIEILMEQLREAKKLSRKTAGNPC